MENKKKLIGLGIGLACLILLVVLLLMNCGGSPVDNEGTGSSGSVSETGDATVSDSVDQQVQSTQEPTEPDGTEPGEETEPDSAENAGVDSTGNYTGAIVEMGTSGSKDDTEETEPEATEPEATEPEETEPEATEPEATEPEETEPEETEPEETEPEATEPEAAEPEATEPEELGITAPGTQTNAYTEVLGEIPDAVSSVEIPAKKTIYYNIYYAAGTQLTIEDTNAYVVYDGKTYKAQNGIVSVELKPEEDEETPVSLKIGNRSKNEKAFELQFGIPVGNKENPVVVEDISGLKISLDPWDTDGYFIHYTAMQDGILTLGLDSITPKNTDCEIVVTRVRTDDNGETSETVAKLSESEDGTISIEAEIGDMIIIQVIAVSDETTTEVTIFGAYEATSGTEEAPTWMDVPEDTIMIPAGKTVYYLAYADGTTMTLTGDSISKVSVEHNGVSYSPKNGVITLPAENSDGTDSCSFAVTNNGKKAVTCTVTFTYPVGDSRNPAEMVIGTNTAAVEAGNTGYYYSWTAGMDGDLTITMDGENANGWYYCINDGDAHYSTDTELTPAETITVKEGDTVQVVVNTCGKKGAVPAGEVSFTAEFQAGSGTEENPYMLVGELEVDLTVGAGKTLYFQCRSLDMQFNLTGTDVEVVHDDITHSDENGQVTFIVTKGDTYNPPLFVITNKSAEDKTYHISFTYVLGSSMNPAPLQMGENTVTLEADNSGYTYQWIAEESGDLTIAMDLENCTTEWVFCVNNLSKIGGYGDNHYSTDEEPVTSETIWVKAGHEIQIVVGTHDPNGKAPAGTVSVTADFVPDNPRTPVATEPEGTEPEATEPELAEAAAIDLELTETMSVEPETTEPEVTEPAATEPQVTEPEVTEPEATEPEVTEPETNEPEVIEPEVMEPEVMEPEVTEPEVTEPEVTEPKETEPETTETEQVESETTEPLTSEPAKKPEEITDSEGEEE